MSEESKLKPGDKVVLDGSPFVYPMTVGGVPPFTPVQNASCLWIDENNNHRNDLYPIAGLRKISDKECERLQHRSMKYKKAKDRIAWYDIMVKWGTFIGAITAAVATIIMAITKS